MILLWMLVCIFLFVQNDSFSYGRNQFQPIRIPAGATVQEGPLRFQPIPINFDVAPFDLVSSTIKHARAHIENEIPGRIKKPIRVDLPTEPIVAVERPSSETVTHSASTSSTTRTSELTRSTTIRESTTRFTSQTTTKAVTTRIIAKESSRRVNSLLFNDEALIQTQAKSLPRKIRKPVLQNKLVKNNEEIIGQDEEVKVTNNILGSLVGPKQEQDFVDDDEESVVPEGDIFGTSKEKLRNFFRNRKPVNARSNILQTIVVESNAPPSTVTQSTFTRTSAPVRPKPTETTTTTTAKVIKSGRSNSLFFSGRQRPNILQRAKSLSESHLGQSPVLEPLTPILKLPAKPVRPIVVSRPSNVEQVVSVNKERKKEEAFDALNENVEKETILDQVVDKARQNVVPVQSKKPSLHVPKKIVKDPASIGKTRLTIRKVLQERMKKELKKKENILKMAIKTVSEEARVIKESLDSITQPQILEESVHEKLSDGRKPKLKNIDIEDNDFRISSVRNKQRKITSGEETRIFNEAIAQAHGRPAVPKKVHSVEKEAGIDDDEASVELEDDLVEKRDQFKNFFGNQKPVDTIPHKTDSLTAVEEARIFDEALIQAHARTLPPKIRKPVSKNKVVKNNGEIIDQDEEVKVTNNILGSLVGPKQEKDFVGEDEASVEPEGDLFGSRKEKLRNFFRNRKPVNAVLQKKIVPKSSLLSIEEETIVDKAMFQAHTKVVPEKIRNPSDIVMKIVADKTLKDARRNSIVEEARKHAHEAIRETSLKENIKEARILQELLRNLKEEIRTVQNNLALITSTKDKVLEIEDKLSLDMILESGENEAKQLFESEESSTTAEEGRIFGEAKIQAHAKSLPTKIRKPSFFREVVSKVDIKKVPVQEAQEDSVQEAQEGRIFGQAKIQANDKSLPTKIRNPSFFGEVVSKVNSKKVPVQEAQEDAVKEVQEDAKVHPTSGVIQAFKILGDSSNQLIFLDTAALRVAGIDVDSGTTISLGDGTKLTKVEGLHTGSDLIGTERNTLVPQSLPEERKTISGAKAVSKSQTLVPLPRQSPVPSTSKAASKVTTPKRTINRINPKVNKSRKPIVFFNKEDNSANFDVVLKVAQQPQTQPEPRPHPQKPRKSRDFLSFSNFPILDNGPDFSDKGEKLHTSRNALLDLQSIAQSVKAVPVSVRVKQPLDNIQIIAKSIKAVPVERKRQNNPLDTLQSIAKSVNAVPVQKKQPISQQPIKDHIIPVNDVHQANIQRVLQAEKDLLEKQNRVQPQQKSRIQEKRLSSLKTVDINSQFLKKKPVNRNLKSIETQQPNQAIPRPLPGLEQHRRQVAELLRAQQELLALG